MPKYNSCNLSSYPLPNYVLSIIYINLRTCKYLNLSAKFPLSSDSTHIKKDHFTMGIFPKAEKGSETL